MYPGEGVQPAVQQQGGHSLSTAVVRHLDQLDLLALQLHHALCGPEAEEVAAACGEALQATGDPQLLPDIACLMHAYAAALGASTSHAETRAAATPPLSPEWCDLASQTLHAALGAACCLQLEALHRQAALIHQALVRTHRARRKWCAHHLLGQHLSAEEQQEMERQQHQGQKQMEEAIRQAPAELCPEAVLGRPAAVVLGALLRWHTQEHGLHLLLSISELGW